MDEILMSLPGGGPLEPPLAAPVSPCDSMVFSFRMMVMTDLPQGPLLLASSRAPESAASLTAHFIPHTQVLIIISRSRSRVRGQVVTEHSINLRRFDSVRLLSIVPNYSHKHTKRLLFYSP